jgi:hypothetical protein
LWNLPRWLGGTARFFSRFVWLAAPLDALVGAQVDHCATCVDCRYAVPDGPVFRHTQERVAKHAEPAAPPISVQEEFFMVWKVEWDGNFVVGGDGARRLTPNFKLREFRFDGAIRVHRELVSSLQLLRNRFARGIGVRGVDADGLGATIEGAPTDGLLAAADALEAHSLFSLAERQGDNSVHVRIADPRDVREVGLEQALGAGLSFGPAQVNFSTGTLQPMFEKFAAADRDALAACFTDPDDWEEWQRVMAMPSRDEQVAWANGISTGTSLANVMQPWKGYFQSWSKKSSANTAANSCGRPASCRLCARISGWITCAASARCTTS